MGAESMNVEGINVRRGDKQEQDTRSMIVTMQEDKAEARDI
jgi:hypothetical protein